MGVSTFSIGILLWKQSLRKCELYEADWHFKHRHSYCLSQTALPLYVCSGLCFFIPAKCMYNKKKNPRNFCGSPCWIGTYFTNVAIEKWSLDFLWFMKNLLREYTIFFLVSQKNIYTNNWKNLPCIQESLHSSGGGGGLFSYRQTSGEMFLHSLALSCPFMSFFTPIQVRTGQIIICRSIGYVEVICTEVYMKGSAIIELFELWEHIVCMCMYIMCVWLCMCVHVCMCLK